jgi:SAM-dependent methyltransferase
VFFLIDLSSRRVQVAGVTKDANRLWMSQMGGNLSDATESFLMGKRYLIHDRDPLFREEFLGMLEASGIESVKLPPRLPNLKACASYYTLFRFDSGRSTAATPFDNRDTPEQLIESMAAIAIDLVLMVDVYHELAYPFEVMTHVRKALKPGGCVVFVEYRKEDPQVPIKEVHKMSVAQLEKEMGVVGFEHLRTLKRLPWQHIVIFEKRE